jgi:hypothetical protein
MLPPQSIAGDFVEIDERAYVIRHRYMEWNGYGLYEASWVGDILFIYDWLFWTGDLWYRRTLLRLANLGLAEYPPEGCFPSWTDVVTRWNKFLSLAKNKFRY